MSTSNNSSTCLPAYIIKGLIQINDSHEICTHFVASCQLFDSHNVGPISCVKEHMSSVFNTSTEVIHSLSLCPVYSSMVADTLCNIDAWKATGEYVTEYVTHILNVSITFGIITTVQNTAYVLPLH